MLKYYTKLKHYMGRFFYVNIHLKLNFCHLFGKKTLPKAQLTQGIEGVDSINIFRSKQKLQQALHSWSNFSLVLLGKEREMRRTTLTNPCSNFEKSMYQFDKFM